MSMACVVAVLDTGVNRDNVNNGNCLPEIFFGAGAEMPAALKVHGTDICNTILKIAPEATLLPVQITNEFGQLNTPLLEAALDWILQEHQRINIKIVCAAFADYTHHASDIAFAATKVHHQIALLKDRGVVVIAAAGNWQAAFKDKAPQGMAWPAVIREVVSAGALDGNGQIAPYSQRLNKAMNTGCATTVFAVPDAPGDTSGATAVVAGVMAQFYMDNSDLTVAALMEQLEWNLQAITDEEGNLWPVLFTGHK